MAKTRVYELAKELGISSKDLTKTLESMGVTVKNHMSTIEEELVDKLIDKYTSSNAEKLEEVEEGEEIEQPKVPISETSTKPQFSQKKKHKDKKQKKGGYHKDNSSHATESNTNKTESDIKIINISGDNILVKDLAEKLGVKSTELVMKLMKMGIMANINQSINIDTATSMAEEYGYIIDSEEVQESTAAEEIIDIEEEIDDETDLIHRPPVVTIMGHVDHGKTSLLDAIRETKVTATEAGGITQHIGAYQVVLDDKKITFLDTPGHEAFTAMRARGAQSTDIAILVVAADDGVMPQTIEAINHAKAAQVPIIVAINKMDKAGANPDRVKQELTEYGLVPEEWGGDTICVPVSALQKNGLDDLLEMILLVSEMLELKANPNRLSKGVIIEAQLDKGRGPIATVLVQNGSLKIGDSLVAGSVFGKVRAMINDKGERVKIASPATPVEVLGLSDVPQAGDIFRSYPDEKQAKAIAEQRRIKKREEELGTNKKVTLDDLFTQIQEGAIKELNIVIKADVQGSVEALRESLERLGNEEVRVKVIHGGVGGITESDIMLAAASNAIILGFNVRPDQNSRKAAENESIDIRLYRVIYNAIEDIKAAITGMLEPTYEESIIGRAEVRATFKVPKVGTIAGCYVTEGKITRQASARLIRDSIVIHEGQLASLKRFKDDAKEVASGFECGIGIERFNDLKEGDIIEAFIMKEVDK